MNAPAQHAARGGSGELAADFAIKGIEIPCAIPLRERPWTRWLLALLVLGVVTVSGVVGAWAYDWRRTQLADLAAQRQCLREFLASAEFAQFVGAADAQLVALNNFIVTQPSAARAALPEVEALEQRDHRLSWALETMPLPVSTAADPTRIAIAHRTIVSRLAQRGYRFDPAAERAARQLFVRLLAPAARAFLQRVRGAGFNALMLDATMQDDAMQVFAAKHGAGEGSHHVVRMFALYAKVGPPMWQAVERDREQRSRVAFAAFKPGR